MRRQNKTIKITDFKPLQEEVIKLRKDKKELIAAIKAMIRHIEVYLPENWQTEKWFIDGKEAIKKIK